MKKLFLIAVLIGVVFIAPPVMADELLNVRARGVEGDLVFEDHSGNDILKLDEIANTSIFFGILAASGYS